MVNHILNSRAILNKAMEAMEALEAMEAMEVMEAILNKATEATLNKAIISSRCTASPQRGLVLDLAAQQLSG